MTKKEYYEYYLFGIKCGIFYLFLILILSFSLFVFVPLDIVSKVERELNLRDDFKRLFKFK